MSWQAWFTLFVAVGALGVMATDRLSPDKTMVGALALLVLSGVLEPGRALAGFASEGMMTVALLFMVAAAVRRSGALAAACGKLLGQPTSILGAQLRLMLPVAALSGFVNNTPLVAMLLPEVRDWSRRSGVAPSRLLIPLSYAAILGGLITLIGTSTNLVVDGMLRQLGRPGLHFFDLTAVGLPLAVLGVLFIAVLGRRLLPDRPYGDMPFADPRGFTAEYLVIKGGVLDGRRLGDVSIPDLPGLHPIEILREGLIIPAPRADEVLQGDDRLVVNMAAGHVLALHRTPGLLPTDHTFSRDPSKKNRVLVELVVSDHCPLVDRVVGDGSFRRHYDAAVVAVARHGERVTVHRGPWVLEAGDSLLVEVSADFLALHRTNPDFYLVTSYGAVYTAARWHRAASVAALVAMASLAALGVLSMFEAAMAATVLLLLTRVISWSDAQDDVNWKVLLTIAAALGLGAALEDSGAARAVGDAIAGVGGEQPWIALAMIYLATVLTTEMVTNNAAAAMMLPIGLAAADRLGVSYMPFAVVIMIAASASFATPIGYQTNLMVYGPGGYRFSDFLRIGIPLTLLLGAAALVLTPIVWPF
jgi:di/tricarboxylate transporter